jgi:hypothetical protein
VQDNSLEDIFKSGQIVCLESDNYGLYGEVIQVITQRQLCWVRPLTIAIAISNYDSSTYDLSSKINADREIIDLRSASDLLLPLTLFRASYDTEAIYILAELAAKQQTTDRQQISVILNNFVQRIWQDNQDKFR